MAYGSPDRLEDVPAYYADIRGGRPIKPERLEDLVARYRRLGIEDSNPLNEITEATRAALEAELGIPVFTGMRHWRPRIADAVEQALAGGADVIVGLVLAPHYSWMSIERYRAQLVDAVAERAGIRFVERWGAEPRVRRPARRAGRRQGCARRLHRAFVAGADPGRGRSVQGRAARDGAARGREGGRGGVVVLVPERVADRRALARAGHPRPPGGARRGRRPRGARRARRLRRRPPRDQVGHRRRGGGAGGRARARARPDRAAERRAGVHPRARRARPARGGCTVTG